MRQFSSWPAQCALTQPALMLMRETVLNLVSNLVSRSFPQNFLSYLYSHNQLKRKRPKRAYWNFSHGEAESRTRSRANVRTVYSARVSVFSSVILMSPYISDSSGQYLQHFTWKKDKTKQSLGKKTFSVTTLEASDAWNFHEDFAGDAM